MNLIKRKVQMWFTRALLRPLSEFFVILRAMASIVALVCDFVIYTAIARASSARLRQ
jgi:hypothetical protein